MGDKYMLRARDYEDKFWEGYQTGNFIKAFFKFLQFKMKYELVIFEARKQ